MTKRFYEGGEKSLAGIKHDGYSSSLSEL